MLLDNFHTASKALRQQSAAAVAAERQRGRAVSNPLDPLLLRLSEDFSDEADLDRRLRELFRVSAAWMRGGVLGATRRVGQKRVGHAAGPGRNGGR